MSSRSSRVECSKSGSRSRRRVVLAAPLVLAGCTQEAAGPPGAATTNRTGRQSSARAPERAPQEYRLPLRMAYARGAAAMAFVPVFIQESGPYYFVLSTGAAHTVVDWQIANALALPAAGGVTPPVAGPVPVQPVGLARVNRWRLDGLDLVPATIVAGALPRNGLAQELRGILGMDVLSRFSSFTLDYDQRVLVLRR